MSTYLSVAHTQPFYNPFSGTTWESLCQKKAYSGLYGAREDNTAADTLTIQVSATPTRLISDPPTSCPHFTLDALPATTLSLYPGLGQTPNMLACIPSGVVCQSFRANYSAEFCLCVDSHPTQ